VTATVPPGASALVWTVSTTDGESVRGPLPTWAADDPSRTDVPPWRLPAELADITHYADMGGLIMSVARGQDPAEAAAVLAVSMQCKPFPEDDEPGIPVVHIQITDDFWLKDLGPDAVADFGQRLRALADRLITTVAPALTAARADWARHYPTPVRLA
jgi:hypothetical protein